MLRRLGYKVNKLDGILGTNTKQMFTEFKKNTFQVEPEIIGSGSVSILIKLFDREMDLIEKETSHPNQPILDAPLLQPKSINEVNWYDFNSSIGKYFTVGELLRFDKERIPNSTAVKNNILKIVLELDKVREAWGKPIGVSSGYRPPHVNRRAGGARFSQHLQGNAVDIYPIGGNGREFEQWLDTHWYGALGWGQRSGRKFTHIDCRNNKGFKTGGSKGPRWNY
jgi:putative chitinase